MAEDRMTVDEMLRIKSLEVSNTLFSGGRQVNEQKFLEFSQQVFDYIKGPPAKTTKRKSGALDKKEE